ncbi:insulinase family protein [Aliikangiella marina]|uniref:Insulinase family protein n=1 Tax=Aliikangiella marina TaxID=1712262 RepID=A0A545TA39_9GAMM|nr:pitrilysin family protein [Aliikangiella marina]TQV74075.1 insulinase family protein [Aliikangiella marina]
MFVTTSFKSKLVLLALILSCFVTPIAAKQKVGVDIPFVKYELDNGLTLIVHQDKKAPIVAVNVWYHVGSKNEKVGKTGFAHLFEHLMFNGSENYNDDYFKPFDRVGATGMNGTTNFDRTNYFQVVPKNALDMALWMESDRMGHLLGAIDQAKLDEQRGVVQNEKRQGENQPYGKVVTTIFENMFPKGHPYAHSVIGSMEDLNAASLEDVYDWFKTYYGAANATLVIAGDVEPEAVKQRVEHFFGHIPSGPPLVKSDQWIAKLEEDVRLTMQDRVPQSRIYKLWKMPSIGSLESTELDLVAGILSEGKNSRLYKRLVYDEQVASDVAAFAFPLEISGIFGIQVTALPGKDLSEIEKSIDNEVSRFLSKGPTREEIKRVVTERRAAFIRGNERIGGFGGKSDTLAFNQVYMGQPDFYKTTLARWNAANIKSLTNVANEWMKAGQFILEVHPFDEGKVSENKVDRSKIPVPSESPTTRFAQYETESLSNGLRVILAQRDSVPVINMRMMIEAGYAADQLAAPGTASMTIDMMDEGTDSRSALGISRELQMLGTELNVSSNLDVSTVSMSTLTENFEASLDIFADVIMNPSFPEDEFTRLQAQRLATIKQEKARPVSMALRVFPSLIYGKNHAYGLPMTGSGFESTVKSMTTDDLKKFHSTWFRPNNATLVVVGNISMAELKRNLEDSFDDWEVGVTRQINISQVAHQDKSKVYLIDRPESAQSIIFAGHIAPPKSNQKEFAFTVMDEVLGGGFNSRLNMNLREDKGWAYGARTILMDANGQRPYIAYAPVQSDKTSEAMQEIYKEFTQIGGESPPTDEEIARAKDAQTLTLAGRWETNGAVEESLAEMVRFNYSPDYWDQYAKNVRQVNQAQIADVTKSVLSPEKLIWVVVGDRAKIESKIKALELGEIVLMNADGEVVE